MAKLTTKQLEYLRNKDFYESYIELLNFRLTYSSMNIENDLGDPSEQHNFMTLKDNMDAFKRILEFVYNPNITLTEQNIIFIGNTINKHAMYISNGFRKNGKNLDGKKDVPISNPEDIEKDLERLLYDYYNTWKELDAFEREAKFHIEFLRIHPFEDGNGRTSRLLLNFNLLRQGYAPVVVPFESRDRYFEARNNNDELWMKTLFKKCSEFESESLDNLIEEYELEKGNANKLV